MQETTAKGTVERARVRTYNRALRADEASVMYCIIDNIRKRLSVRHVGPSSVLNDQEVHVTELENAPSMVKFRVRSTCPIAFTDVR
eukprot:7368807-Alexandrium_andersonii.AAC.1